MINSIDNDRAILIGVLLISVPVYIIMYSLFLAPLFPKFLSHFFAISIKNGTIFWILPLLALPLAWLYWSFTIPSWKLWAYSRVENVASLKVQAIENKLIWPDGHVFEKTEICNNKMRQEILRLEHRSE
ncbi:MAG: hypothetical protein AAB680_03305 [Pseudomonadota bacterium]